MTKNTAASALGRLGGRSRKSGASSAKGARGAKIVKNQAAVALGRLGGEANKGKSSEAKRETAQANGSKGGRPTLYSEAEMRAAVKRLKTESVAAVAEAMNVSSHTIYSWMRKLRAATGATRAAK
jgi:hypothetical protein